MHGWTSNSRTREDAAEVHGLSEGKRVSGHNCPNTHNIDEGWSHHSLRFPGGKRGSEWLYNHAHATQRMTGGARVWIQASNTNAWAPFTQAHAQLLGCQGKV